MKIKGLYACWSVIKKTLLLYMMYTYNVKPYFFKEGIEHVKKETEKVHNIT